MREVLFSVIMHKVYLSRRRKMVFGWKLFVTESSDFGRIRRVAEDIVMVENH